MKIEQIAAITTDMSRSIMVLDPTGDWARDTVTAVHVLHPVHVGRRFTVDLAFNYNVIDGKEFELIKLISGESVQFVENSFRRQRPHSGVSHFGGHVEDYVKAPMALFGEIAAHETLGLICHQVSVTISHSGDHDRFYAYAFIDTRKTLGTWTKVIQRLESSKQPDVSDWISRCSLLDRGLKGKLHGE